MINRIRLQPLVSLKNNTILGFEVLYKKLNAASYPSASFILESISSCLCKDNFLMFINMTVEDVIDKNFCKSFLDVLTKKQIDGKNIVLEVSENTPPDSLSQAKQTLSLLRNYDIGIALDDFGTQYSSLSFLRELPIDIVKIDKKFVQEAPSSKKSRILLEFCTKISHDIGCSVIAEGIETQDQLDYVKNYGIDMGQGFLFTTPSRYLGKNMERFIDFYDFASQTTKTASKICLCANM